MSQDQPHNSRPEEASAADGQDPNNSPDQSAWADSQSGEPLTDAAFAESGDSDPAAGVHDDHPETRDEEMARLRHEANEAGKRVLQAQAEAENFRKRMRRDYEDQLKYAAMPLVADILQVRDNLMRAIDAASGEATDGLRDGVQMVLKQLDDVFGKHAIAEIPSDGELFDPNFHEAISQMPSPDVAEGMIAHVAVPGFQMHDRVIRPSQVVVSAGGPNPGGPNPGGQG